MRPRGTIKSRSPGSYWIRYSLGRDPVSGKRRFATATVRGTRKQAERELVRLLRKALKKPRRGYGSNQQRRIRDVPCSCPSLRLKNFAIGSENKQRSCCDLAFVRLVRAWFVVVRMETQNTPTASLTNSATLLVGLVYQTSAFMIFDTAMLLSSSPAECIPRLFKSA